MFMSSINLASRILLLAALLIGPSTRFCTGASCLPAPSGLISWWSGDDHLQDQTGRNPGFARGAVHFGDGKVGHGFALTDRGEYIESTTSGLNVGTGDFTIEAWISTVATKANSAIASFQAQSPGLYV